MDRTKVDRNGEKEPPRGKEWAQIQDVCLAALLAEMSALAPKVAVFTIFKDYRLDVRNMLLGMGYKEDLVTFDSDCSTTILATDAGKKHAILTKHPQGWERIFRDPVIGYIKTLL